MWLWWIAGVVVLLVLAWAVARATRSSGSGRGPAEESPEAVLKRRYAQGEIERDEYERRLSDLRK